jgi:hypothetical protein
MEQSSKYPRLVKLLLFVAGVVNSIVDTVFRLPLFLSVAVTGLLVSVPVVGVWVLFVLSFGLPPLFRATLIWTMIVLLVLLSAAMDYVRSSK